MEAESFHRHVRVGWVISCNGLLYAVAVEPAMGPSFSTFSVTIPDWKCRSSPGTVCPAGGNSLLLRQWRALSVHLRPKLAANGRAACCARNLEPPPDRHPRIVRGSDRQESACPRSRSGT